MAVAELTVSPVVLVYAEVRRPEPVKRDCEYVRSSLNSGELIYFKLR